jgi:Yip1 domain
LLVQTQAEAPVPGPAAPAAILALVAPDIGMERVARTGRVRWLLLIAMMCSLAAGLTAAWKVDARNATLASLEKQGQIQTTSDQQIADQTKAAERTFIVMRVGSALVLPAVDLALCCVGLFALSWFLRGRTSGRAVAAVSAAALLPSAIGNVFEAIAAATRRSISPSAQPLVPRDLSALYASVAGHPLAGAAGRLLSAIDVFSLWAAFLLAYGLVFAANLPRRRAVAGTLIGWLCFRLLTQVAMGGGGGPQMGGPHP